MPFYLAEPVGGGTSEENAFRAPVDDRRQIIDLRGDVLRPEGRMLVWTAGTTPREALPLGDDPKAPLPSSVLRRLGNDLALNLVGTAVGEIAAELLTTHATAEGDKTRPNPLRFSGRQRVDPKDGERSQYRAVRLGPGEPIWEQFYKGGPGATIADDFNRANQVGLGSPAEGWSWVTSSGGWEIVSNQAEQTDEFVAVQAYSDEALDTDDHYSEADWVSATRRAGLIIRRHASDASYYEVWNSVPADVGAIRLYRVVTGSYTELTDQDDVSLPVHARLEMDGSNWDLIIDASSYVSGTDTGVTGNVLAGIYGRGGTLDNFEAGDLGAVTTPVSKTLALQWDTAAAIAETVEAQWDTHAAVGDAAEFEWSVATTIGDSVEADWATRAAAGDTVEAQWGVAALAGDTADLQWDVAAAAGDAVDLDWSVATTIGETLETDWSVLAAVGDSLETIWDVASTGTVGDTISLRWATRAVVGDDVAVEWDVHDAVGDDVEVDWATRVLAGETVETVWSVYELAGDTLELVWDVDSDIVAPTFAIESEGRSAGAVEATDRLVGFVEGG